MAQAFDSLPGRGQMIVADVLIDPNDPVSRETLLQFMFADPIDKNCLYFMNQGGKVVAIPRDADSCYVGPAVTNYIGAATADQFRIEKLPPCKSWRPFKGYA